MIGSQVIVTCALNSIDRLDGHRLNAFFIPSVPLNAERKYKFKKIHCENSSR